MILEKFKSTVKKHSMIKKGGRILAGVSGGPDSVALLLLLNKLRRELKFSIFVIHVDHGLRKDSRKDMIFVRNLCKKLKLPFFSKKIDLSSKTGSTEEKARNARLQAFLAFSKKLGADTLALGHNLDDQAETVLMRILRGTGLQGLSAMLPKKKIGRMSIIRPMLEIKRSQIEKMLKKNKASFRRDPTNSKDIFFRNKIRLKLLPLLEKEYNVNIKEVLSNTAESTGYDYDFMRRYALKHLPGRNKSISLSKFANTHPAVNRMIIREVISSLKGNTRRVDFRHIKEIEDLALNRPADSIVDLPGRISVLKSRKNLRFYRRKKQ